MGEIYSKADQSQTPGINRQQQNPQALGGGRSSAYPGANVAHSGFSNSVNSGTRNAASAGSGAGKYDGLYRRDAGASQHGPTNQPPAPQTVPDPHLLYARNSACVPTVVTPQQYKAAESLVSLNQATVVGSNSYMTSVAAGTHRVGAPLQVQASLIGGQVPPQPPPGSQQQPYFNHTQKRPQLNPNKRHRIDLYGHPAHSQVTSHREPQDSKAPYGGTSSIPVTVSQLVNSDVNNRYQNNSQAPPPREAAYHPQVEAISPALEEVRLDPNLQKEKNEVAETLQRMEREITNTDKQLKTLRSKQALLESRINQQGEDHLETSDDEDIVEERRFHNPFEAVTAENRRRALSAAKSLEEHSGTWRKDSSSIPLYHQPSDIPRVYEEKMKYKVFKPRLIEWLSRRQAAERKRLSYLAAQYDKSSRNWVKKQEKFLNSHKRRNKEMKWRECFEKNFPDVKKNREEYERWKQEGFEMNEEYASNAFLVYHDVDKMKDYAIDPPITLAPWVRRYRYLDKNGFVRDPLQQHETAQDLSLKWTTQERAIFKDRYVNFPKNFSAIASYLEKKTVADCIQFYYLTKKSENYKQLVKRHHSKRRRVQQERQLQRQQQQNQQQSQQQNQPQQQQQQQQQTAQPASIKQEKNEIIDPTSTCSTEALKGVHKREPDQDDDANGPAGGGTGGGNTSNGNKSFSQSNANENSTANSLKIKSSSPSSNSDRTDVQAPGNGDGETEQTVARDSAVDDSETDSAKRDADNSVSASPSANVAATITASSSAINVPSDSSSITTATTNLQSKILTAVSATVTASSVATPPPNPSPISIANKIAVASSPSLVGTASSRSHDVHNLALCNQPNDGSRERKSSENSSVSKSPEKFFHDRNTISDLIQNAIENNLSMDTWSMEARNAGDRTSPSKRPDNEMRVQAKDVTGSSSILYPGHSQGQSHSVKEAIDKAKSALRQPIINGPPLRLSDYQMAMAKHPADVGFVHSQMATSRTLGVPSGSLHPGMRTSPLRVDTGQDVTDSPLITRHSPSNLGNPRPPPKGPGGAPYMNPVGWPSTSLADLSDPFRIRGGVPSYPPYSTAHSSLNPHITGSEHGLFNRSLLVSEFNKGGIVSKLAPQRPVTQLTPSAIPLQNRLQPEYYVGRALDPSLLPQPQPMKPIPTSSAHHPAASVRPLTPTIPSALIGPPRPGSHLQTHSGMCVTLAQPTPTHLPGLPSSHKPSLPLPGLQPLSRSGIDPEAYKQDCFNRQAEMRYRQEVEPFLFRDRSDSERTRTSSEASQIYDLIKRRPRGGGSGIPGFASQRQPPNVPPTSSSAGNPVPRSQEQTQMPPPVGVPQRSSSFSRKPEFPVSSVPASSITPSHRDTSSSSFEPGASDPVALTSSSVTTTTTTTESPTNTVSTITATSAAHGTVPSRHTDTFTASQLTDSHDEEKESTNDDASNDSSSKANSRLSPHPKSAAKSNSQEKPITAASLIDAIIVSQISQPEGATDEQSDDSEKSNNQARDMLRDVERLHDKRLTAPSTLSSAGTTQTPGTIASTLPIKKNTSIRPMQITLVDRINQVIAEDYGNSNVASYKDHTSQPSPNMLHSSKLVSSSSHSDDYDTDRQHSRSAHDEIYSSGSSKDAQDSDIVITKTQHPPKLDMMRSQNDSHDTSKKQIIDLDSQVQELIVKHVGMEQSSTRNEHRDENPHRLSPNHDKKIDHHDITESDFSHKDGDNSSALSKSKLDGKQEPSGNLESITKRTEKKNDQVDETENEYHRSQDAPYGFKENMPDKQALADEPESFIVHKRRKVYDQVQKSNKQRNAELSQKLQTQQIPNTDADDRQSPNKSASQNNGPMDVTTGEKERLTDSSFVVASTSSTGITADDSSKSGSSTLNLLHHALSNKQPLALVEPLDQLSDEQLAYRKRSNSDIGSIRQAVRRSDYERLRETTQRIAIVTKASSAVGGFNANKSNGRQAFFTKHVDPKIELALESDDPAVFSQTEHLTSSPKKMVGSLIVTSSGNSDSTSRTDNPLKRRAIESAKSSNFRPPKKRYEHESSWMDPPNPESPQTYIAPVTPPLEEGIPEEEECDNPTGCESSLNVSDESESPSKFSVRPSSDQASDRASVGSCSSQDMEGMSDTSEDGALQIDLEAGVARTGPPPLTAVAASATAAAGMGDK